MSMPTIPGIPPDTWEQILQVLSQLNTSVAELGEQGITTFEQLKQWLATQGYELVEISKVVGYTVCKTTAVDPTTSNAVATRVATDIATTGGAGTAVAQFTTGGNRTLGLVSKVIAVGACLSLLVSTIGASLVTDKVKEDLITSADPYTIDGENVPVLIGKDGKTYFPDKMVEAVRAKAIELGIFDTEQGIIPPSTGPRFVWQSPFPIYPGGATFIGKGNETDVVSKTKAFSNLVGTSPVYPICIEYTSNKDGAQVSTLCLVSRQSFTGSYYDKTVYTNGYVWENTSTITSSRESNDGHGTAFYYYNLGAQFYPPNLPDNRAVCNSRISPSNVYYMMGDYLWCIEHGTEVGGGGVEGITPAQDLITAGVADTTKPLTEVLPQLATGQMSIASPTEDDLTHKSNWYPVSINSEDVFTDGATEEETSSATDGDVKPDVQPSLLDAIEELIKNLYPDGTPEIPVSDSGDTPPAEPPLISGSANGLWSIYNPTLQQVQDFGAYLWSENILDQITRMFNSPIDAVIGFHMIYCTPVKGAAKNIKCGYLDTGVSSITVANQYATIDCGTIEVPEFYRTALDYVSTKLALYLPFIGIVPLSTAVCMGSTLQVIYRIDVLTGTCLAQVKVIKENSDAVMYAFEGNCSVQIPLTATTYTGIASALINTVSAGLSVFMGDYISAAGDVGSALGAGMTNLSGTKQSGQMGANAGALGIRIPYLIITHPVSYDAQQYNTQYGYPLNQTISLDSVTGYTRVKDIHLAGIPCTDDELEMIERLLKDGVIIN